MFLKGCIIKVVFVLVRAPNDLCVYILPISVRFPYDLLRPSVSRHCLRKNKVGRQPYTSVSVSEYASRKYNHITRSYGPQTLNNKTGGIHKSLLSAYAGEYHTLFRMFPLGDLIPSVRLGWAMWSQIKRAGDLIEIPVGEYKGNRT